MQQRASQHRPWDFAYRDDCLAEAEGAAAAKLALMLRLIVAQGVLPQHHPPVLPAMNVVGPLQTHRQTHYLLREGHARTQSQCR